jgi:D-alanyl-D-alanine carboxypeptidase/D-alanyl-D-alanine-endopeptidase (penicillin-binding protein 4)
MKYKWLLIAMTGLFVMSCGGNKKQSSKDTERQAPANNIPIDNDLRNRLADFASKPRMKGLFAFYVYDLTADKPVYGCNERVAIPSASCLKLLSGVAGLDLLGTDYRYLTSLYTRGRTKGGVLNGDVIFKGGLDPQLNAPELPTFAKALKKRGIKKFTGKLIVDLTIKEPVKSEKHWFPWDLSFSKYGILYKGSDKLTKELKAAFHNQGFAVADSQIVLGATPRGAHLAFKYFRPIDPIIHKMWKNSSNTQATSLLYTIGHRINPKGNFPATGVDYLHRFMRENLGLHDKSLVVHDGCGLCTYNRLSPFALVTILHYGYQHPAIYKKLQENLSVSGIDGTLRSELSSPKLRGKIHGKTGTLSHPFGISSLAGYCESGNGHTLAFSIMDSEMSVLDARVLQRKLGEELIK